MILGYARVSTVDQDPALQLDALRVAGAERLWVDHASGGSRDRPELAAMLEQAREGDVIVVWRLDRLGRSLAHLIEVVGDLEARGVGLRSLSEGLETSTPGGRLIFHVFGALAEFERSLIRERTMAGLAAARARGRVGGRPAKLTPDQVKRARRALSGPEPRPSVGEVAADLGVHRTTLHRALARG